MATGIVSEQGQMRNPHREDSRGAQAVGEKLVRHFDSGVLIDCRFNQCGGDGFGAGFQYVCFERADKGRFVGAGQDKPQNEHGCMRKS